MENKAMGLERRHKNYLQPLVDTGFADMEFADAELEMGTGEVVEPDPPDIASARWAVDKEQRFPEKPWQLE